MMAELVLQERLTLDDAMLKGFRTFNNGCNFALRFCADGSVWMNYGCYCLINLATGSEALLVGFLGREKETKWKRIDQIVKKETLLELKKRKPCTHCGGFEFELLPKGE